MIIRSFFIPGIAHRSYLIGGIGTCFIVDPSRDTDRYIYAAEEEGMRITGILETHLHADFISGHLDLKQKTGAEIYMPGRAGCLFPHTPVTHGSNITFEDIRVEVRETPGHTPEHVSYVVTHLSRGEDPVAVFCGDTLFVGDVGRPDLFPGRAEELADALYTSLHEQLLTLPDYCEVYPAHGSGSLCGRQISSKQSSTIGYERKFNYPLTISDRTKFISHLTNEMPQAPDHFHRCSEINRIGPQLLADLSEPEALRARQVSDLYEDTQYEIVDIRMYDAFGAMHIPGSWNINIEVNFSTFSGWVLDPDKIHIIVAQNKDQVQAGVHMMRRVGIDIIAGYLAGGTQSWALSGLETEHCLICSPSELEERTSSEPSLLILDVRTPGEYSGSHIQNSISIPWYDLRTRYQELEKGKPIVVLCGTGVRAGIAASILKRKGFSDVSILAGGYTGWMASGR